MSEGGRGTETQGKQGAAAEARLQEVERELGEPEADLQAEYTSEEMSVCVSRIQTGPPVHFCL